MFGLFGKVKMLLILTAIIGAVGFGAWKYYTYTQEQIRVYATNAATAEQAAIASEVAFKSMQQDLKNVQKQFNEVTEEFSNAQKRVDTLEEKLSEHDLGQLAQARPGLVEKIINNASNEVIRCVEILSGSPLTEKEINATKPSKINSECPDIANPNYKP
jgi:hypothetical protein